MLTLTSATVLYERALRRMMMLAGARSHRIRYGRGIVHALDVPGHGSLPPVVLLHGFSASGASQYGALTRHLRPHVQRIVMPDLPGHGVSTVPPTLCGSVMLDALTMMLERLMDGPYLLFGSSMAGGLAVRYAHRRPDDIAALMLCSPGGAPLAPDELASLKAMFRIGDHRKALAFVDRLFPGGHPLRQAYAWGIRSQFNRPHLRQLVDGFGDEELLQPHELGSLEMPVHLMWGQNDHILPHSALEFYRRHLPQHAEIDTPATFGHAPFLHRADEVAERLLRFARRTDA
jgi:pimeloyl-ACP methyl ester carboxylesterase